MHHNTKTIIEEKIKLKVTISQIEELILAIKDKAVSSPDQKWPDLHEYLKLQKLILLEKPKPRV